MKFSNYIIFLFLLSIFIPACSENPVNGETSQDLIGIWTFKSFDDDITTMKRDLSLDPDNPGFIFSKASKLVERKNSGFCGTPPVSYANFEGKWGFKADDIISVIVDFWGGLESYELHIISVNKSELKFKHVRI